jgi:hypothetical protein
VSLVEELLGFEISRKIRDLDSKTTILVSVTGRRIIAVSVVIVMWGYREMGY